MGSSGEQQRRPGDDGARHGHPLLLAGRELLGLVALLAGQVHAGDRVADARRQVAAPRILAGDGERQPHVLDDVEQRHQVERLEHEPGALAPQARRLRHRTAGRWPRPRAGPRRWSAGPGRRAAGAAWYLPEPDGPMSATNSPGITWQRHAAHRLDDLAGHPVLPGDARASRIGDARVAGR